MQVESFLKLTMEIPEIQIKWDDSTWKWTDNIQHSQWTYCCYIIKLKLLVAISGCKINKWTTLQSLTSSHCHHYHLEHLGEVDLVHDAEDDEGVVVHLQQLRYPVWPGSSLDTRTAPSRFFKLKHGTFLHWASSSWENFIFSLNALSQGLHSSYCQ